MIQKAPAALENDGGAASIRAHLLFIEARFYEDIADLLVEGAISECARRGVTFERIAVPGALEIPQVLAIAAEARIAGRATFDGAVAMGCVIRGETAHYDIVCNNANHWLMDVAIRQSFPVGNAILTVDNRAQALARAEGGIMGKGGDAARACIRLVETKRAVWEIPA
jgi:6,7-dimethyl-8-ribityllumazine synthase